MVVTPNLGLLRTWWEFEPLVRDVEQQVHHVLAHTPGATLMIVGHSMGGLLWLEVLNRHRDWWSQVHSLTLIGSPVGGSRLAESIGHLSMGITVAQDLAKDRRAMAETLAATIPTLAIAGDAWHGYDYLVAVDATRFRCARWVCLPGLSHRKLRNHPDVAHVIQSFWQEVTG